MMLKLLGPTSSISFIFYVFAVCYHPIRPSVCRQCLSVCNTGAPYSGGWNFPQYFYGIRYLGHPL